MSAPHIAIVTACYDRWEHLRVSLPSWERMPGAPPIFVGTYESDPVPAWLGGVRLVTVRDEPFHRTRLRNCVAEVARRAVEPEWLLFIDADITVVDPDVFVRALAPDPTPRYVLDSPWALRRERARLSPKDPEHEDPGKRGTHLVRTELFFEVGGFDQRMTGWGFEDRNLYLRYCDAVGEGGCYERAGIVHIDHSDELRSRHSPGGLERLASALANFRTHVEDPDPLGRSWQDDFGYPDYTVTSPAGTASARSDSSPVAST